MSSVKHKSSVDFGSLMEMRVAVEMSVREMEKRGHRVLPSTLKKLEELLAELAAMGYRQTPTTRDPDNSR